MATGRKVTLTLQKPIRTVQTDRSAPETWIDLVTFRAPMVPRSISEVGFMGRDAAFRSYRIVVRQSQLGGKTGSVTSMSGITNTTYEFIDNSLGEVNDHYNGLYLTWTSGDNAGQGAEVNDYTASTGKVFVASGDAFPNAISVGDGYTMEFVAELKEANRFQATMERETKTLTIIGVQNYHDRWYDVSVQEIK